MGKRGLRKYFFTKKRTPKSSLLFHEWYNFFENLWMTNSHIWEYFSIKSNFLLVESIDKFWIAYSLESYCIIDTSSPKSSKVSLFESSPDIAIKSCFHPSILCSRKYSRVEHSISFCSFDYFFMSLFCHESSLYTYHSSIVKLYVGREQLSCSCFI